MQHVKRGGGVLRFEDTREAFKAQSPFSPFIQKRGERERSTAEGAGSTVIDRQQRLDD